MTEKIIRKPETSYGFQVFKLGFELYKRQSLPLFLLAFGSLLFSLMTYPLPMVLEFVVYFLSPVVTIGVLRCIRFLDESPKPVTTAETFKYFYDPSRRQDYLPLCLVALITPSLHLFTGASLGINSIGALAALVIELMIGIGFFYGLPLLEFNRLSAKDAMQLSLKASAVNWKALTFYSFVMLLYGLLSVISLGIGLIFLIPVGAATRYYLWKVSFGSDGAPGSLPDFDGKNGSSDGSRDVTPGAAGSV